MVVHRKPRNSPLARVKEFQSTKLSKSMISLQYLLNFARTLDNYKSFQKT